MAFGFGKLAVLESKLDIYEDLSKEMLDKLERAVTTISENSNRVAVVLERHESRLDEGDKSNQLIIRMIEEMKSTWLLRSCVVAVCFVGSGIRLLKTV